MSNFAQSCVDPSSVFMRFLYTCALLLLVSCGDAESGQSDCSTTDDCAGKFKLLPCERVGCIKGACVVDVLADDEFCDDGNLCTVSSTCMQGKCIGSPIDCSSESKCVHALGCNPVTGECNFSPVLDGTSCQDGKKCTIGDLCVDGVCAANPIECNDNIACTLDSCDESTGQCVFDAAGCECSTNADCDDGNDCNGAEQCLPSSLSCAPGESVSCDEFTTECTEGSCNPENGACIQTKKADGSGCSDGNACSLADVCIDGKCVGGELVSCPAPDTCHLDGICNKDTGKCTFPPLSNGTVCDDGDSCTVGDVCQAGVCESGAPSSFAGAIGGLHGDVLHDIAAIDGGGSLAVGVTHADDAGSSDGWVVRFDKYGQKVWERTFGSAGSDKLNSVVSSINGGGWIATGLTVGANGFDAIWLVSIAEDGTTLWEKKLSMVAANDTVAQQGIAIAQRNDGTLVLLAAIGDYGHAVLAYLDSDGGIKDSFAFKNEKGLRPEGMLDMGVGGTVLVGATGPEGNSRGWYAHVAFNGVMKVEKIFPGSKNDILRSAASIGPKGFMLVGESSTMGQGKTDGWLVRLDAKSNLKWDATYGGTEFDSFNDIAVSQETGEAVVVGQSQSEISGVYMGWVVHVSSFGAMLGKVTFGQGESGLNAVVKSQISSDMLIAAGTVIKPGLMNPDGWLIQTNPADNQCGVPGSMW